MKGYPKKPVCVNIGLGHRGKKGLHSLRSLDQVTHNLVLLIGRPIVVATRFSELVLDIGLHCFSLLLRGVKVKLNRHFGPHEIADVLLRPTCDE